MYKLRTTKFRIVAIAGLLTGSALFSAQAIAGHHETSNSDIVETAVAAGSFSTLAAALEAAGLVDTLSSEGPFTVLAPTDEAFARLPEGTVESLLLPENKDQLIAILTYHVVPGEVLAAEVVKLTEAPTVNGGLLNIRVDEGTVYVNDSEIVATDVMASNGVIHVIDTVLIPN